MEFLRFLTGALLVMLPGILLASLIQLGRTLLARCICGAWLGLALAIYLGTAISHLDLLWFYPLWAAIAGAFFVGCLFRKSAWRFSERNDPRELRWMIAVLLLVAATRYAIALPDILPMGIDPPEFFLILARKIQLTHQAIINCQPFESAQVNYPAGAPTLVAILSTICGLSVQTVFKDLMPMLGVLGTAQVYVLTRRVTDEVGAGLYAAMAYGMWAGLGSVDFYKWGGMPNEIAILLFLASLSAWLESEGRGFRPFAASLLYAASMLSHHHTQIASAGVLVTLFVWMILHHKYRRDARTLAGWILAALLLDGFFLLSYIPKIATLGHTRALYSEWPMSLQVLVPYMGLPFVAAAIAGAVFCIGRRRVRCHPVIACACVVLIGMFISCEYLLPNGAPPPNRRHWVMFTPSHFLNDLPCFMAVFAGIAVAVVQTRMRLNRITMMIAMLLISLSIYNVWCDQLGGSGVSTDFIAACQWIEQNTSPDSIVRGNAWACYLSWRCGEQFNFPDSEPSDDPHPKSEHVALMLAGKIPPDSPQMKEVEIVRVGEDSGRPVLWKSRGEFEVVLDWSH
jgi:hypothetical protein